MKYKITIESKKGKRVLKCDDYLLLAETDIKLDVSSSKKDEQEIIIMIMPLVETLNHELEKINPTLTMDN